MCNCTSGDAPLGAGPESILPIAVMDSGLARSLSSGRALRGPVGAPRKDELIFWAGGGATSVNNGSSGDICCGVLESPTRSWLNGPSYGGGKPSRRFGHQFATAPM